jgi:hypothetical protein
MQRPSAVGSNPVGCLQPVEGWLWCWAIGRQQRRIERLQWDLRLPRPNWDLNEQLSQERCFFVNYEF